MKDRVGSFSALPGLLSECPFLGGKRTYKWQEADVARPMSGIGGKADVPEHPSERLLIAEAVEEVGAVKYFATFVPVS